MFQKNRLWFQYQHDPELLKEYIKDLEDNFESNLGTYNDLTQLNLYLEEANELNEQLEKDQL